MRGRLAAFATETPLGAASPLSRFLRVLETRGAPSGSTAFVAHRPPFTYAAAAGVLVAAAVLLIIVLAPASSVAQTTIRQHRLRMAGRLVLDTHADCCKDLKEWFEARAKRPIAVPEIKIEAVVVEGGKLYRHKTGNEMFFIACRLKGEPVSVFVCCGPNMAMPEGEEFTLVGRKAVLSRGNDHTMISWRVGEYVNVLVTCCGVEKSKSIFGSIKSL